MPVINAGYGNPGARVPFGKPPEKGNLQAEVNYLAASWRGINLPTQQAAGY